ncbi:AAA family ATPase [uncultured Agathobaculum sp.]|uniref:AAA family ATPase n=1 Tax=uncultured Agathobaculum sp. TaxID=2048140 RepID=UPI00320B1618
MTLQEILSRLHGVHGSGKQYTARCPAHDDHNASLSIGQGDDGKILLHCHAGCDVENILSALGLKKADLFNKPDAVQDFAPVARSGTMQAASEEDTYIYRDGNNIPVLRKVRVRRPDGGKSFYWQYLDGGQWKKGRNGQAAPLYRQSDLTGAHAVYLVEGEKDVKTLERNGLRAVSPPDGAKSKWREEYTAELAGHNVVILQDNDDPGKAFAQMAAGELAGKAKSVKVIDLTEDWPELPAHGDISDVLALFPDDDPLGKLLKRVEDAPEWVGIGRAEGAPEKIDYSRLIAKSAAEIDFSKTPPTIFYIEGIIAQGLTFLNAFSKVGKSRVILQMLLAICRGLSFFGKATKKSSVLYLALEDERRDFEGRLKAFLQGEPPPENLYWLTKEDFNYEPPAIDNGLFELLETQLKEHPEIKVIAIDVFGVIRSKRLQNEDFSMHERRDLNALLKFTAFNDLAMINAHHVSKTGMAQNRISSTGSGAGSYVLSGTVHTEIEIALDPDDPKRAKFSVKGRRMPAISFAIRDEYPFWKLEGDWAAIKIAENPIITTVKWLVSQNGTWKGSAKDLLDANKANSFLPPILKAFNKNTLEKLAREFQSAGIYYVQHPNGSGGVLHEFTSTDLSNDVIEIVDGETWEDIKLKV